MYESTSGLYFPGIVLINYFVIIRVNHKVLYGTPLDILSIESANAIISLYWALLIPINNVPMSKLRWYMGMEYGLLSSIGFWFILKRACAVIGPKTIGKNTE